MALPLLMAVLPAEGAVTLIAAMTGAAENPPATAPTTVDGSPRPAASGTALFTLNDDMTGMSFTAVIVNIDVTSSQTPDANDNLTAAEIRGALTVVPEPSTAALCGLGLTADLLKRRLRIFAPVVFFYPVLPQTDRSARNKRSLHDFLKSIAGASPDWPV